MWDRTRSSLILSIAVVACEADTRGLDRLGGRAECRQAEPEVTTGMIEAREFDRPLETTDVSDGRVFFVTRGAQRVVAFDPRDGSEETLTTPDVRSGVIDASRGAALLVEHPDDARGVSVFHRSADGETLLATVQTIVPGGDDDVYAGFDATRADRDSAAWRTLDAIWRWDRGSDPQLVFSGEYLSHPALGADHVAFTVGGPERRVMVQRRGEEAEVVAAGEVGWAVSSGGSIFYVEEGRLTRFDLASRAKAVLHPGPCGPPNADGDRAVAACGGAGWPAPGDLIAYYDGVETHELFADGGYQYGPRLRGGRILWIRYGSPDVVCNPPAEASGEILWWDPDVSAEPMVLGTVGAPCLCCDAYWPPALLAFDGDVAAWNYGQEGETSFIGWGRVERREVCAFE